MAKLLPVLLLIAFLLYLLVMLLKQMQYGRRLRLRVRKLYASPVYDALRPYLREARHRRAEMITIDKNGVTFRYFIPAGYVTVFSMKDHGFAPLTPEQQDAFRLVLEEKIPALSTAGHYHLTKNKRRLVDGTVEYEQQYLMQQEYKADISRAAYLDPRLQISEFTAKGGLP